MVMRAASILLAWVGKKDVREKRNSQHWDRCSENQNESFQQGKPAQSRAIGLRHGLGRDCKRGMKEGRRVCNLGRGHSQNGDSTGRIERNNFLILDQKQTFKGGKRAR